MVFLRHEIFITLRRLWRNIYSLVQPISLYLSHWRQFLDPVSKFTRFTCYICYISLKSYWINNNIFSKIVSTGCWVSYKHGLPTLHPTSSFMSIYQCVSRIIGEDVNKPNQTKHFFGCNFRLQSRKRSKNCFKWYKCSENVLEKIMTSSR